MPVRSLMVHLDDKMNHYRATAQVSFKTRLPYLALAIFKTRAFSAMEYIVEPLGLETEIIFEARGISDEILGKPAPKSSLRQTWV